MKPGSELCAENRKLIIGELKKRGVNIKYVQYEGIGHTLPEPKQHELERILHYLDGR